MTIDQILSIVVAAAPAITAIIGIICAVAKAVSSNKLTSKQVIDKFDELQESVLDMREYTELKHQLAIAHQENIELKKKMNELLTKIDRVDRSKEE